MSLLYQLGRPQPNEGRRRDFMKRPLLVLCCLFFGSYPALAQGSGKVTRGSSGPAKSLPCASEAASLCGLPFDATVPVAAEKCLRINRAQLGPKCQAFLKDLDHSREPFVPILEKNCEADIKTECGCYAERTQILMCLLERMDRVSCSCRKTYDEIFASMLKAKMEAVQNSYKML